MNKDIVNARTGLGGGIGMLLGFVFAGGPIGAGIGAIVGAGIANTATSAKKGVMTPKRQLVFQRAMESVKSPADLRHLSSVFAGEGLQVEAAQLAKRATLRELPEPVKAKRREAFRKAMASDNVEIITNVAAKFGAEGAVITAKSLYDHAEAVRAAHAAGQSAKTQPRQIIGVFADKLGKAIMNFGLEHPLTQQAAANVIRAQGKKPTVGLVNETIRMASGAMGTQGPRQAAPVPQQPAGEDDIASAVAMTQALDHVEPGTSADAAAARPAPGAPMPATLPDSGAMEPTVIGPQPPVVEQPLVATNPAIGGDPNIGVDIPVDEAAIEEAAMAEQQAAGPARMRVA